MPEKSEGQGGIACMGGSQESGAQLGSHLGIEQPGRLENLLSNNSGLLAGGRLTTWKLGSGPAIALIKA